MSIALVAHGIGKYTDVVTIDTTGATLLVLCIGTLNWNPSGATITDGNGNTWRFLTSVYDSSGGGYGLVIAYAYDHAGSPLACGAGHTFSVSGSGTFRTFGISAWSGTVTGSDPLGAQNAHKLYPGPRDTTIQPGSVSPAAGDLVIAAQSSTSGTDVLPYTTSSPTLTKIDTHAYSFANDPNLEDDYLISSGGATNPTYTGTVTAYRVAAIATFKPASGGGGAGFQSAWAAQANRILGGLVQ
jgi:hypothetical protein